MSEQFGCRVSELIKKNGLSQRKLAMMVGVTEPTISRYINGSREPTVTIIISIAQALNTSPDYLLGSIADADADYRLCRLLFARSADNWSPSQRTELTKYLKRRRPAMASE